MEKLLVDYPEIEKSSAILFFLFDSCRLTRSASLYHSLGVIELTVALNYVFDQPTVRRPMRIRCSIYVLMFPTIGD